MSQAVKIRRLHHFWRYLYTILLILFLPLILLLGRKKLSLQHAKSTQYSVFLKNRRFSERFGVVRTDIAHVDLLIHCVSVGELNASSTLIKRLLVDYPYCKIMVTTTSVTGAMRAYDLFKDSVQHHFLPIDIPLIMNGFVKTLKPTLVCITEVEIWPNFVNTCWKNNIPLVLLNARMSDKSLPTYRRLSKLFRPTLRKFTFICAQNQSSYDNFLSLGLFKSQVRLCQNMKFDISLDNEDVDKGKVLMEQFGLAGKPLFVVASSHEPEEKHLLSAYARLKKQFPFLVLVIVPRHPHRFDEVYELCSASGFLTEKFTQHINASQSEIKMSEVTPNILLVDAMGWLKAAYSISTFAFIGGSFAEKGGHNALECAAYSKPMIMGPSTFNNPGICQQLAKCGALTIVENYDDLTQQAEQWLRFSDQAARDGDAGKQTVESNKGAVEATLTLLKPLLNRLEA